MLTVALALPIRPSALAEPTTPSTPVPQTPQLTALQQRAEEVRGRLTAATEAYEAGRVRLLQAEASAAHARAVAETVQRRVLQTAQQVDELVRESYKGGSTDDVSAVLNADGDDVGALLDAVGYLSYVAEGRRDTLQQHLVAREHADDVTRTAELAAGAVELEQRRVAAQVDDLRRQSAAAATELEALMRRLIAEQRAREAAARRQAARERARRSALAVAAVSGPCRDEVGWLGREWGGWPNGLIPPGAMCPLPVSGQLLRPDAAVAFQRLNAAYVQRFGKAMCVTDSYRSYAQQVVTYQQKPSLAAVPGTSNHGWGLAVDLCGGAESFGSPVDLWMRANAGRYGWVHPAWADPSGPRPEPWHWEFGKIS